MSVTLPLLDGTPMPQVEQPPQRGLDLPGIAHQTRLHTELCQAS